MGCGASAANGPNKKGDGEAKLISRNKKFIKEPEPMAEKITEDEQDHLKTINAKQFETELFWEKKPSQEQKHNESEKKNEKQVVVHAEDITQQKTLFIQKVFLKEIIKKQTGKRPEVKKLTLTFSEKPLKKTESIVEVSEVKQQTEPETEVVEEIIELKQRYPDEIYTQILFDVINHQFQRCQAFEFNETGRVHYQNATGRHDKFAVDLGEDTFKEIGLDLVNTDKILKKLTFGAGRFSLREYFIMKLCFQEFYTKENTSELASIFCRLFSIMHTICEKKMYYSNLHPDNVQFKLSSQDNLFKLYLSDFSLYSSDYKIINGFSNFYFLNESTRNQENYKHLTFESDDQRMKAELYPIAIIFLEVLLAQITLKKQLDEKSLQLKLTRELINVMINNLPFKESDNTINLLLEDQQAIIQLKSKVADDIVQMKTNPEFRQQQFQLIAQAFDEDLVNFIKSLFEENYQINDLLESFKKIQAKFQITPEEEKFPKIPISHASYNIILISQLYQMMNSKSVDNENLSKFKSYLDILLVDVYFSQFQQHCLVYCLNQEKNWKFLNDLYKFANSSKQYQIIQNIARVYEMLGQYNIVQQLYKRCASISLSKKMVSKIGQDLSCLASASSQLKNYDESVSFYKQAIQTDEIVLGKDHPEYAIHLNDLAVVYRIQHNHDEAIKLYLQALKIAQKVLGPEHSEVLIYINNIAQVYYEMHQYEESLKQYFKALEIDIKQLGKNHPEIACRYTNVGCVYKALKQFDKALEYFQMAFDINEKIFAADDKQIALDLINVGYMHDLMQKFDKALPLYMRALKIDQQYYGPNHFKVALDMNFIAGLYKQQNKFEKAAEYYQYILDIYENKYGKEHIQIVPHINNLALVFKAMSKYQEALDLYQRVLKIEEATYEQDSQKLCDNLNNLALMHKCTEKYQISLELYERVYNIDKKVYEKNDSALLSDQNNIAQILNLLGKYNESVDLYKYIMSIELSKGERNSINYSTHLNDIANIYNHEQQYELAVKLYLEELEIEQQIYGLYHPKISNLCNCIARVYDSDFKYEEAKVMYQKAIDINRKCQKQ